MPNVLPLPGEVQASVLSVSWTGKGGWSSRGRVEEMFSTLAYHFCSILYQSGNWEGGAEGKTVEVSGQMKAGIPTSQLPEMTI